MRKMMMFFCLLVMCAACGSEKEKVNVVCTFQGDSEKVAIRQTITLQAEDDELVGFIEDVAFTFEDVNRYQEDIDVLKKEYEQKEACPEVLKEDKCTKNIKFSWSFEENVLSTKTKIDVAKALEDDEDLEIFEEIPKEDSYISLDKTKKVLEEQAYTCEQKK